MAELSIERGRMKIQYRYEAKADHQPQPGEWSDLLRRELYPYIADQSLQLAVDLALRLKRPLLLEGEPGVGKSRLAYAVAHEFSQKYSTNKWKFQLLDVKSNSKAQDAFYTYDYIGRLQAAQLAETGISDPAADPADPEKYVEWGAIGTAFRDSHKGYQTIILIDEIDKADSDFCNDLLLVLEERRFEVRELRSKSKNSEEGYWITANPEYPPVIFITSNQEQSLPAAFLRRCLYHYINFPSKTQLIDILKQRFGSPSDDMVKKVVNRFTELRQLMEDDKGEAEKKVSTSELIDWFTVLNDYEPEAVLAWLNTDKLPFANTLLKGRDDFRNYSSLEDSDS